MTLLTEMAPSHARAYLVNKEFAALSKEFGMPVPKWSIIEGVTSLYFWDTNDIAFSEVVLDKGSDDLVRLVASHEWEHYAQDEKWGWPRGFRRLKEIDAEAFAIRRVAKDGTRYPVVFSRATPLVDWLQIAFRGDVTAIGAGRPWRLICTGPLSSREGTDAQQRDYTAIRP